MSDSIFSPEQFNALFGEALDQGGENLTKVADSTGLFIQKRLRENAFSRKILPPQPITAREAQRRVDDEGLEYIDDLEPDSLAMRINFRGEPEKTYITAPRYAIRFFTIASDRFMKSEQELRSYRMPLTKVIEQNTVKDIQEQEDRKFMEHVNSAVYLATRRRYNDLVADGTLSTSADLPTTAELAAYLFTKDKTATFPIADSALDRADGFFSNIILSDESEFSRTVLRDLVNVQANRELDAKVFLVHQATWNDILAWAENEAGLEVTSEIVRGGYKTATILGITFVTSIRANRQIIRPGQIYSFPSPQFLGRFLLLEQTKFYIDKRGRFIEMEAWEDIAVGFGNVRGIGVLLLNGASLPLQVNMTSDGSGVFELVNDNSVSSQPTPV